jgi:hypothetical protein
MPNQSAFLYRSFPYANSNLSLARKFPQSPHASIVTVVTSGSAEGVDVGVAVMLGVVISVEGV